MPTGVLTFLFTDVEGSTRRWVADEPSMAASLRVHDDVVRSVVETHGGYVFSTAGDSFAMAFEDAEEAVACAVGVQDALARVVWPGAPLRVRIGLHLGVADERGGDFFGSVERDDLIDLGQHRLRDVAEPVPCSRSATETSLRCASSLPS